MLDIIHSFLQNLATEEKDPQDDRILASSVDLNIEVREIWVQRNPQRDKIDPRGQDLN